MRPVRCERDALHGRAEARMTIYDVTVTLHAALPTFDGEPAPRLEQIKQIGVAGEDANVSVLTLGVHAGTHVDAPCHFIPGGAGVDELPIDALVGPCRVVRIDAERAIQASDLEACGAGTERLLLKTRSAALWDEPEFRPDFVALTSEAAGWLVQQGVRLVGIDYLSIDPYDAHPQAAHLMLLGAGVVVVEGLDLRRVPPGDYDLACLPIKLRGADGAPARVVLRSID